MITTTTTIKSRYNETDQMGIIHHANYLIYMEQARLEWLDALGFSYSKMEEDGVLLPVYNIDITYKKPIKFSDQIHVQCTLKNLPTSRVIFDYKLKNTQGDICASATLTLVFTDATTFRPRRPPQDFLDVCKREMDI